MTRMKALRGAVRCVRCPQHVAVRAQTCYGVRCYGRRGRGWTATELLEGEDEISVARPEVKPHKVASAHPVPEHIPKPPWYLGKSPPTDPPPEVHGPEGIAKMRAAGKLAASILSEAGKLCRPGVPTETIDEVVHRLTIDAGAYPSPLRYGKPPFPKSVCTSVNEVICHGIPDARKLRNGDIVNVDVTVWLDGYHGDTSRTFLVGEVAPETQKLVAVTKEALHKGISVCKPNTEFKEIGKAIDDYVSSQGFVVNLDFIGHGVGKHFHALPWVFPWRNSHRGRMQLGQTFTIEPAVHFKNCRHWLWKDGWTAVAVDGLPSAQFEHTVLITEGGVEILTACEE